MSFLLKKRKFFLFIFLFFVFFLDSKTVLGQTQNLPGFDQVFNTNSIPSNNSSAVSGIKPSMPDTLSQAAEKSIGQSTDVDAQDPNQDPANEQKSGFWSALVDGAGSMVVAAIFFVPLLALVVFGHFAMTLTAVFTGISVFAFDSAVQKGVYEISNIVNNTDIIQTSWLIFRNIANVGLIFAVLFIAIQTILRASSYDSKKLLGRVIIAGLLMNFSFFFAAIVVDVSNEMSLVVYDEIAETTGESLGSPNIANFLFTKYSMAAISSSFLSGVDKNQAKILEDTVASAKQEIRGANPVTNFMTNFTMLALGLWIAAGVNLIVTIVFFSVTGLIIGRLVAILLLLVVSPIGFVGMVLPGTEKMAKEWRESLFGHCFFLPIFMLFLLVALKIIDKLPEISKRQQPLAQNSMDFTSLTSELAPVIINFFIITGLLLGALKMANMLSSKGSSAIGKISASVSSSVTGAMIGGSALLGRNTLGAGASVISQNESVKNGLRSMGPLGGFISKQLEGVAKAGFDARSSKAFKGVASATGIGGDFAKPFATGKDGFKGQTDRLANTISKTYAAIPDKKIDDTDPVKVALDTAEKNFEAQKDLLKEAQKEFSKGAITQTDFDKAKYSHDLAEKAQKTAQNNYRMEQNPAKQTFVSQTNSPVSIANVWYAAPNNKARDVVKKESNLTDAEKLHKETMQALNDIKNAGK